jgi:hypothetical protein
MDFRRSGQLDERRRRVLRDELAQPADNESADAAPTTGSGSAKGPVRAYCPAVLAERQPRVTDFVPIRPLWTVVTILLALTAVAAIECVHIYARTTDLGSPVHFASLDAASSGSVAAWFSALALVAGAALSLVTFGIRLHRVDDYRGRYRVWLWTAAALALASLDAATGIHNALGLALARLAGTTPTSGSLAAAATISWLAVYGLVFGTLAIRLAIEIWSSLPAVAALAIAGLLYLIAGLDVLGMLPERGPLVDSVVRTSIVLLAHVSLMSAVGLFARHVCLDATGRLKVHIDPDKKRQTKKSRAKLKIVKDDKSDDDAKPAAKPAAAAAVKSSGPLRFGLASSSSQPKAAASIAKSAASSADYDDEEDEDDDSGDQRLSRAERRRLKKLARRDGQRRAA